MCIGEIYISLSKMLRHVRPCFEHLALWGLVLVLRIADHCTIYKQRPVRVERYAAHGFGIRDAVIDYETH